MGCGKSKHAVETATTIVKSTNADGSNQTTVVKSTNSDANKQTTTTVTDTAPDSSSSSVIQKEVETKSLFVEDTKEKIVTKVDPPPAAAAGTKTENAATKDTAEELKEDVKVKDSKLTDASEAQTEDVSATEVVKQGENVSLEKSGGVNAAIADKVVPASGKDDVGITGAVKDNEEKAESAVQVENEALKKEEGKKESVGAKEDEKMKEPDLTKDTKTKTEFLTPDTKTKTEFMTPTLSEDVVGPFEVAKGNEDVVNESKEENITDEKPVKTIDGSSNAKDDNIKIKESKPAEPIKESTKVESKKEVKETEADIGKAKISPAVETEKVPTASEANVAGTQKKEP